MAPNANHDTYQQILDLQRQVEELRLESLRQTSINAAQHQKISQLELRFNAIHRISTWHLEFDNWCLEWDSALTNLGLSYATAYSNFKTAREEGDKEAQKWAQIGMLVLSAVTAGGLALVAGKLKADWKSAKEAQVFDLNKTLPLWTRKEAFGAPKVWYSGMDELTFDTFSIATRTLAGDLASLGYSAGLESPSPQALPIESPILFYLTRKKQLDNAKRKVFNELLSMAYTISAPAATLPDYHRILMELHAAYARWSAGIQTDPNYRVPKINSWDEVTNEIERGFWAVWWADMAPVHSLHNSKPPSYPTIVGTAIKDEMERIGIAKMAIGDDEFGVMGPLDRGDLADWAKEWKPKKQFGLLN